MKNRIVIERILRSMERELSEINNELAQCPKGKLMLTMRRGKLIKQQSFMKKNKRVRISLEKMPEIGDGLIRKLYLEKLKEAVENDIELLSYVLSRYSETGFEALLQQMPEKYRSFKPELYLKKWNPTGRKLWENQTFESNPFQPENKLHLTSKGLKVRSKSEVLLAEILYEEGIPFRYEMALQIDNKKYYPDFTCKIPNGKIIYIEHCGLTNDSDYMRHHKKKLADYENVGIVPWKNLIVTYDDEDGKINMAAVRAEITAKLL